MAEDGVPATPVASTAASHAVGDHHASSADKHATVGAIPVLPQVTYAKPFPDISKIEVFDGENFNLDLHGVAFALTEAKPVDPTSAEFEVWVHANKACRHTIISTLSNELFDVYFSYKEVYAIWESMITKYNAEDVGKQKFVIDKYYRWEMVDDKCLKAQINEYHKLLEDLKAENINLQEEFVAGLLIEKLPQSWNDYKQQLKHKHKQLSLKELITHIIIEDTNRKGVQKREGTRTGHQRKSGAR